MSAGAPCASPRTARYRRRQPERTVQAHLATWRARTRERASVARRTCCVTSPRSRRAPPDDPTAIEGIDAYRMHLPKWAMAPTSGAGAAEHGGRANRPGVAALYLALDTETAIKEYQQVSTLLPPGTPISDRVTVAPLVDFRKGYQATQRSPLWEELFCDWRELWFNQHIEPPSWVLADEAIAAGAKGILFPSRLSAGINLVLYTELLGQADAIEAHDPTGALPKNQDSWA